MGDDVYRYVEVLNRLKRGTVEGRVLWERASVSVHHYVVALDDGHSAAVASTAGGSAVRFTMTNSQGLETLHLDSGRVTEDVLRLALLQLFVTVRDSLVMRAADEALQAVKDL